MNAMTEPGALAPVITETRATCPYCGVGCGVVIQASQGHIVGVRGDADHPANAGRLCTKGQSLHLTAASHVARQTRLLQPMFRPVKGAPAQALSWERAIDTAASQLARTVVQHGPDAVGLYVSGQFLTEDYYVFSKLARAVIQTPHIDSNSRLCMSSAVAAYKMTLGADAPPACYDDIDHAACIFIAGSNAAWAHPILFRRIEAARQANPQLKIIVVDPRTTDTAAVADLHLAIEPGTDVVLFHGMLHLMIANGWIASDFVSARTHGWDALTNLVKGFEPAHVAQVCGIPEAALRTAAQWFATSPATLSLYCQGLNQSNNGTANNATLINLHLATAQIGKPGAGPFSLTGQPNAMGGRETGCMATLLPAHRDIRNADDRAAVAAHWGVEAIPDSAGRTAVDLFTAAADGAIRFLWIACTNPAQSLPDQRTIRRALERCDYVVVQEAFQSASTLSYADLMLPAAAWGEKSGTVTNSERCISRVHAAIAPSGEAKPDWWIAQSIGQRFAQHMGRPEVSSRLSFSGPEAIWNEHRESTRGRDLDITGLSYTQLEDGPAQWPFPVGAKRGLQRLYTDGVFATPDGRAQFAALSWKPPAEERSARYPFALTTGRLRDQWHGMTRTLQVGRLFAHAPEPTVQMNPSDLQRLGIASGELVEVRSQRGSVVVAAEASAQIPRQQAFMGMHWGQEVLSGRDADGRALTGVNALMASDRCAVSHQPDLKHAAVHIAKSDLSSERAWSLVAMAWLPADRVWQIRQHLQMQLSMFDYASLVPFSDPQAPLTHTAPRTGLLMRLANRTAADASAVQRITDALLLSGATCLKYEDARNARLRIVRLVQPPTGIPGAEGEQGPGGLAPTIGTLPSASDGRLDNALSRCLDGFLVAGDSRSAVWLRTVLQQAIALDWTARQWLSASDAPPQSVAVASPQVCSCFNVSAHAITVCLDGMLEKADGVARPDVATLSSSQCLSGLQQQLQCGTGCGSCVPELRLRIQAALAVRATPQLC